MAGVTSISRRLVQASIDQSDHRFKVRKEFDPIADAVLLEGDALAWLTKLEKHSGSFVSLAISSPPYNIGKEYEVAKELDAYLGEQKSILKSLCRVIKPGGSLCWQVGNYVDDTEVYPLDIYYYPIFKGLGLKLRNRIVWHFGHGLHASRRFSGRYETLLWFTKGDGYTFNLDSVRVPSKYPGKTYYKGAKRGQPSGNPLGKNPSDFWEFLEREWQSGIWDIPNVKANHPEKTEHPCQFPVELVERCVLALTDPGETVLDPFAGVGSAGIAALKNGRRTILIDKEKRYLEIAEQRIRSLQEGRLRLRAIGTPVYLPTGREKIARRPAAWKD